MGWKEWTLLGGATKRKLAFRKICFFVVQKFVNDVKQGQQIVPDLLGRMMKPTRLVKAELRPNLLKLSQCEPQITEIQI